MYTYNVLYVYILYQIHMYLNALYTHVYIKSVIYITKSYNYNLYTHIWLVLLYKNQREIVFCVKIF